MTEVKNADEQIVDILSAAGVRVIHWHLPTELSERPIGATITHDDILDFHDLLSGDSWYSDLTETHER